MKVQRLDHVSFTVSELDRSVAFYRRFGFEPIKRYRSDGVDGEDGAASTNAIVDLVWLRMPGTAVMLELARYPHHPVERARANSRVGAAHVCVAVGDIGACYAELIAEGVEFLSEPREDAFGTRWVYLRDPDGNTVELIQDPPVQADVTSGSDG